eukprot:GGOE01064648.1.p1 GENE.GGOE01064648.1~~GGOE01064648.1.p1  ORF type:complete len:106 (-),score=1.82 GGOE01064648.1:27-344(-)
MKCVLSLQVQIHTRACVSLSSDLWCGKLWFERSSVDKQKEQPPTCNCLPEIVKSFVELLSNILLHQECTFVRETEGNSHCLTGLPSHETLLASNVAHRPLQIAEH